MKTLKSFDRHTISGKPMFIIRRPDAYAPLAENEMPIRGEVVQIDGNTFTVESAEMVGDSSFNWWPDIAIMVADGG